MELYRPYEEKILKLARIKAKILRYKYLILACLLVIIGGISTLLYFKGDIREDVQLQAQYTYGDRIANESKAFMSKTKLAFYKDGEEVSYPTYPGIYTARVVANGAFGSKKYGEMQTITIVQKKAKVELSSRSFVYGETPTLVINRAVEGDRIDEDSLTFLYYDTYGDNAMVQIAPDCLVVFNAEGKNVTDCYDFQNSDYDKKPIVWTQRYIHIETGSKKQVYDDTDVSCEEYVIKEGDLAKGDVLSVEGYTYLHGVGETQNHAEFTMRNSAGKDVTKMYHIVKSFGEIQVTPRPLTIRTEDVQKLFDGLPFGEPSYQTDNLVEGHRIQVLSYCRETQPGNYIHFLSYDIQTQGGEIVTHNYDIREEWGALTIYADELVVAIYGESVYDGQTVTQFPLNILQGQLWYADRFIVMETEGYDLENQRKDIKEVGEYRVEILSYEIRDMDGNAVNYYKVKLQTGGYMVTPRSATVALEDAQKYYDRTPLTSSAFYETNVVAGHMVNVSVLGSITEPGRTENVLQSVEIYDENNQNVTNNYLISTHNSWLYVWKRRVVIVPLPISKTYDGTPIDYPKEMSDADKIAVLWEDPNDALQDGKALLKGDSIGFTLISLQESLVNVGSTEIILRGAYIQHADGSRDNGRYYEVTVQSSVAQVKPRQIEIRSLSYTKVDDGMPLKGGADDCYISKGALANGDVIEYVVRAQQTEIGTSVNLISEVRIIRGGVIVGYVQCDDNGDVIGGNDDLMNYQITVEHGTLTILEGETKQSSHTW